MVVLVDGDALVVDSPGLSVASRSIVDALSANLNVSSVSRACRIPSAVLVSHKDQAR